MDKEVSKEQIELEAKSGYRPLAIESGITLLPLSELGDREFELLSYMLLNREIEDSIHSNMTNISLMQGVSERGRDCVFYKDGKVSGLVQCKKYNGRLTRPQVIKELIKFLLFSILDPNILPDSKHFEYKLYVSEDFTEPAISLIYQYKDEVEKEMSSGNVQKYIQELSEEYESFSSIKDNPPIEKVNQLLKDIHVSSSNRSDLSYRICKYNEIVSTFFNIKTVVSLDGADDLIRKALDDYGLKYITDEDLKILHDRISNTKEDKRVNLGFVDFFGYSKDFFKYLKGAGLKEVLESIVKVNMILGKKQTDFVSTEINKAVLMEITTKLLRTGKIHPFSVGIASPYLFARLTLKLVSGDMPKKILVKIYPQSFKSKEEIIAEISQKLFDSSERVMAGDYSQLVGNPDVVQFKKRIFEHIHHGLKSIDDAKKVFEKDIKIIAPVLDMIEGHIGSLLSDKKTIVIKDASFLESGKGINRIAKTIKHIE